MRADLLLVARGLAPSRAKAQEAIAAGLVTTAGRPVARPSDLLAEDTALEAEAPYPWVSRAGVKLAHALDRFGIPVAGRHALDLGASTGGFSHVLLARGIASVLAVDVGHGQFDARLAADPRVRVAEGVDARALTPGDVARPIDLLVADVSFVSIRKVIAAPLALCRSGADLVLLIKPPFEVGRERIGKGGRVADDVAEAVARAVADDLARAHGLIPRGLQPSPIRGGDGNREWLWAAQTSSMSVSTIEMPKPSSPT